MILQALATYYERLAAEGGVAPQGFKRIEIPFTPIFVPALTVTIINAGRSR